MTNRLFIGWDPREAAAFHTFAHSVITRASRPIEIIPLVQSQLRAAGVYSRPRGEPAATEFSFTRFLVPHLSGYRGYSIFADCDMLCRVDIDTVFADMHELAPVYVCKHDYVPKSAIKMDGQVQTTYPRKNWSSFMVFDNARCRVLTPEYVNRASGRDLHQFYWLGNAPEHRVGSLPLGWNWLVDEYEHNDDAKMLHYTCGGPWFAETANCDHALDWLLERDHMSGVLAGVAT